MRTARPATSTCATWGRWRRACSWRRDTRARPHELTGPSAITYGQIAETLTAVLGRPIRYVPISHEQYKRALLGAGYARALGGRAGGPQPLLRRGNAAGVSPSVRRVTGRDVIPFAQFARDYADKLR